MNLLRRWGGLPYKNRQHTLVDQKSRQFGLTFFSFKTNSIYYQVKRMEMLIVLEIIRTVFVDGRHELDYAHHSGRPHRKMHLENSDESIFKPIR